MLISHIVFVRLALLGVLCLMTPGCASDEKQDTVKTTPDSSTTQELALSACEGTQSTLAVQVPQTIEMVMPFTGSERRLEKMRVPDSFRLVNSQNLPLRLQVQRPSTSGFSYGVWNTFLAGDEFVVPAREGSLRCVFSQTQSGMNSDTKTLLLGQQDAFQTGFMSEEEVLPSAEACLKQHFPEDTPFVSLMRSQNQGELLTFEIEIELTDHFPAYQTEDVIYPFKLESQVPGVSDTHFFIQIQDGQYRVITPSYAGDCEQPPLTTRELRQKLS